MSKQILMEMTEYNQDLEKSFLKGLSHGLTMVKDLFDNDGANTTLAANADPVLVDFVNYIKGLNAKLKNGTSGAV